MIRKQTDYSKHDEVSQATNRGNVKQKGDFLTDALHIFVLCSFAIAQPLFDLLSRNAEFFVAQRSERVDVILLVLIPVVLIPALVVMVEGVAGLLGRRVRKGVHFLVAAGLVAVIALPVMNGLGGIPGTILLIGVVLLGVAVAVSYVRFHPVRMFLTVLSPAPLLFTGLFLFNSQVSKVVFPKKDSFTVTSKVDATTPVVIVVFDEFSVTSLMDERRQIDPIRYPNFAALARDATWFRNATTVHEGTEGAIPAILTGNYPAETHLPAAADYPHNLFTLLARTYDLKVWETITELCPEQLCAEQLEKEGLAQRMHALLSDLSVVYLHIILPGEFTAEMPAVNRTWKNFTKGDSTSQSWKKWLHEDRAQRFTDFVYTIQSSDHPTLYFLHTLLPHAQYEYLPSGKRYGNDNSLNGLLPNTGGKWGADEILVVQSHQRYLLQVGFVDRLLGQLITQLKTVGLYDRSLVVITADHGVSFRKNNFRRKLTEKNYQDIMPIPLFIKAPYQHEGVISDRNVETIDILPTIADILGIHLPWKTDGHSALDTSVPERAEKVIFGKTAGRLVFEPALAAKYVTLERKLSLFGSGTKPDGLFKIGPYNNLVGRPISELSVVGEADVKIKIDQESLFERLDMDASFVPVQITGGILASQNTGTPLNLAVAVNGTIRAVTQTFPRDGSTEEFTAIVPETSIQAGKNDVEVFVVSEAEGQPRLHRTKNRSALIYSLTLSTRESGETISSSNGTFIQVIPAALNGYLDAAVIKSDSMEFRGWAADVKNFQLPEGILIFVDGKFFYSGRTNADRPDVAKAYRNAALEMAGFNYTLPLGSLKNIANYEVRVFALSKNGAASELNYPHGNQLNVKP